MLSTLTAPVSPPRTQIEPQISHFSSNCRGRRQFEYERSPDPLTQRERLDPDGNTLRGRSFIDPSLYNFRA